MRHFRVCPYPEEAELAASWVAGVARQGNNKRTASTEAIGCTIEGGQDAKTGILVYSFDRDSRRESEMTTNRGIRHGR